ncbi:hypothetical protein RhiirA1_457905 [Rhizophagus irregularis]|uniref:Uncharacterized protein n=1 Tax=Rhizophagus irregularis TaxID=588596 RepID=A0A2N0RX57_9GLOM|nr:hypothetical protein RhiirA1_457905 [Rhizophagus irregularis]
MEKERTEKKKGSEVIIEMEKIIRQQDIFDKANAVRRVCKALEFINKRKKFLCEEMVAYINCIIWRFIKYKPDDFKLLDVQRNVMKNLVLGREIKGTIIVAYLLEYYSRHATDYAGWMSTVSKTLPLLFKYNYDDYIRKLFCKRMFCKSKLPFNTKTQYYYSSKISRKE